MAAKEIKDQPSPHGIGEEIQPLVIKDMEDRMRVGVERYGEALKANNGRDALIDLYQELLDAAVYIRQRIEEVKDLRTMAKAYYINNPKHIKEDFQIFDGVITVDGDKD